MTEPTRPDPAFAAAIVALLRNLSDAMLAAMHDAAPNDPFIVAELAARETARAIRRAKGGAQ